MKSICLQNILFDSSERLQETKELFIRSPQNQPKATAQPERSSIVLSTGTELDLSTYFNMFNLGKWNKYCNFNTLSLQFNYSGEVVITIYFHTPISRKKVAETRLSGKGHAEIPLPKNLQRGFLSAAFQVEQAEAARTTTAAEISNPGWYASVDSGINKIKPAIVICTYKRMDYLKKNLATLSSSLPRGWQVITVDNDSSITDEFKKKYNNSFTFINNPNTGGSGGFTRGMIEAIKQDYTHAILMDDDIELDPEALQRTNSLLLLLKDNYKQHFIAGAMFRLDKQCVQHESTAYWDGIQMHSLRHRLDMKKVRNILKNENAVRKKHRYAGWWYCGIPLTEGIENDLPFPMFVGGDDIEYSLRRAKGFIELNGICVWHPPFEGKNSALRQHYLVTRNGLVINARHGFGVMKSALLVWLRLAREFFKRDKDARKMIRWGVGDFLEGPEYVAGLKNPFTVQGPELDKKQPGVFGLIRRYKAVKKKYTHAVFDVGVWERINRIVKK